MTPSPFRSPVLKLGIFICLIAMACGRPPRVDNGEEYTPKLPLSEAEELMKYLGEKDVEYAVYDRYSILHKLNREWEEAIKYSDKSININEEKNARPELANSYRMRAEIYVARGDAKAACEYYDRALELYGELGNDNMVEKVRNAMESLN